MTRLTRTVVIAVEVVLVLVIAARWGAAEPTAASRANTGRTATGPTTTAPANPEPANPESANPESANPEVADPVAPTPDQDSEVVLLAGDSILRQAGPALDEAFGPEVVVRNEAVNGSGLLTPAVFDWVEQLRRLVAEQDPDVVVLLWIGNYSDTELWTGADGQTVPLNTLAFYAAWSEQADRVMQELEASDADVYWVLPPPAYTELNQQITANLREVYTQMAARWPSVQLIDANDGLAGPSGEFLGSVVEPGGEIVDLRASDTVHLTEAGATRLAQTIAQGIEASVSG